MSNKYPPFIVLLNTRVFTLITYTVQTNSINVFCVAYAL